jgi:hypothetical protein
MLPSYSFTRSVKHARLTLLALLTLSAINFAQGVGYSVNTGDN